MITVFCFTFFIIFLMNDQWIIFVGCLFFCQFWLGFSRSLVGLFGLIFCGEFDPGSGRTLAACLTHASRTERPLRGYSSGERVSNTWVICLVLWDKPGKLGLILDRTTL